MKYTITINQAGIADAGLADLTDLIDWAIIDYISRWQTNPKAARMGDMVWIDYSHMIAEMPLMGIKTKSSISARVKKLVSLGLLDAERDTASRIYMRVTEKLLSITDFRGPAPFVETTQRSPGRTESFVETNDSVRSDEPISTSVSVDQEQEEGDGSPSRPRPREIAEEYNRRFPNAIQMLQLSKDRAEKCRARINNELPTWDDWNRYFDAIEASDFLMSRTDPGPGRSKPFRLNFDFVIRQSACIAIMEGKYDN